VNNLDDDIEDIVNEPIGNVGEHSDSRVSRIRRSFKSRRHRLDDFVESMSEERSIGYIPKAITKMYLKSSDFVAEHYLGGVQRPLDYTFAFFGVGLFLRKEQTAFSEILDIKPWIATFGNAVTGLPVGLSYYFGPNFVSNCFGYLNGSNPEFNMIDAPDSWSDYLTFGFASVNVGWDVFRMAASPITKRAYPGFGLGVTAVNLQSIYLNRDEFIPYVKQIGNQWKDGIKNVFGIGSDNYPDY
jgi:hypothetical protein